MAVKQLGTDAIDAMVGGSHEVTGIAFPAMGMQPYYQWLMQTLHLLAEASCGALRVVRDDADDTTVCVMPGRASIGGVALDWVGGTLDLAGFNNQTVFVWLAESSGEAVVDCADSGTGWSGSTHIKLAEVTVSAGEVTAILDRRFETVFRV